MNEYMSVPDERLAPRLVISAMVFLGAFLSFSMEPLVGRLITPFFGGAVHVWTVSLMIFQALLFAGYLYAHLVARHLGAWHLLLLLLPLLQWPLGFTSQIAPNASTLTLIGALLGQISLPFAVLSTTAVIAQSWWYNASRGVEHSSPFFLYGLSNWGAMVALFAYPFILEPLFGITVQRWLWSFGYLFYAGFTVGTWYLLRPRNLLPTPKEDEVTRPTRLMILRWLALSAAPSALMLAVTNLMAMEVGSFPLVWVFPLALYLGSFIIAFSDKQKQIVRPLDFWLLEIALLALLSSHLSVLGVWLLPIILSSFYALCLIANRQLYRLRPHPSQLTSYYLTIALGGWIGGVFVSLVAPRLFSSLAEYPVAVIVLLLASWPVAWFAWWRTTSRLKGYSRLVLITTLATVLGLSFWYDSKAHSFRNAYGISRIIDQPASEGVPSYRMLVHGQTLHGVQYLDPDRQREPLAYYFFGGALEQAMSLRNPDELVAMIGLGAGDTLPWFHAGENITIFEIDPDMEGLARHGFTYLKDSPAHIKIQVGDARLNLAEEADKGMAPYGSIFVDAFSGDGIPIHLLTLEALDVYVSRLTDDGIIVFHISNRTYDLIPVLKAAAQARGLAAVATTKPGKNFEKLRTDPTVLVMARQADRLEPLLLNERWSRLGGDDGLAARRTWTDDYINILAPLLEKIKQNLLTPIKCPPSNSL